MKYARAATISASAFRDRRIVDGHGALKAAPRPMVSRAVWLTIGMSRRLEHWLSTTKCFMLRAADRFGDQRAGVMHARRRN